MKSSLIRSFEIKEENFQQSTRLTNPQVREQLIDKYELSSTADITEFLVVEEEGIFKRGVYKLRTFGRGEIVVKVLRKTKAGAEKYYEELKTTQLAWQQDSLLGPRILKVKFRSKKPDYNEKTGLLFIEFEVAKETLAQRINRRDHYTEEQRVKDFRDLVETVTYLHRRGDEVGRNFHGDLKPDNIFVVEHLNADGQTVDCLKIGDIEESLGTLPYRFLSTISLQGLQKGNIPPPEKKDDLMALKMIFLELAYDFRLFDLCAELLKKGSKELEQFIKKDAQERKEFIEKNGKKQKYFKKHLS